MAELLHGLGNDRQRSWTTFTTSAGMVDLVPDNYSEAIASIAEYVDPLLSGEVTAGQWDPAVRQWVGRTRR
ncbi:MAG: hypothetical protein ACLQPH_03795 [Acidimicrobiales bacterium]